MVKTGEKKMFFQLELCSFELYEYSAQKVDYSKTHGISKSSIPSYSEISTIFISGWLVKENILIESFFFSQFFYKKYFPISFFIQ